jgi:hypothetical protein
VRAELRDGKHPHLRLYCDSEGSALMYQVTGVLPYLTSRGGKLKEPRHAKRQAAEGSHAARQETDNRRVSHAADEETSN